MSWLSEGLNKLGGVGKAINAIGGPVVSAVGKVTHAIPVVGGIQDAVAGLGGLIPGALDPFKSGSAANGVLGGATGLSGGQSGGTGMLGILQALNAANLGKQSTDYAKNAAGQVQASYDQRAPLRTAGIAGMLNPVRPDESQLSAISQAGNPFARVGAVK